ncbi:MAG: Rnase Y domain-containing protein, partial [Patescibacteria group bacterium]|nr:Rnase Y domain-containing protein [Patescibacteria group bacterium]
MTIALIVLSIVVVTSLGFSVYLFKTGQKPEATSPKMSEDEAVRVASSKAKGILDSAEKEAGVIVENAKKKSRDVQRHANELDSQLVRRESSLAEREKLIDRKVDEVDHMKQGVKKEKEQVESVRQRLEGQLEKVSELSRDEARELLRNEIAEDMKNHYAKRLRETEKRLEVEADDKAKEVLVTSMQKVATEYVGETTVSTVKIEDEKIKGRIIGREGRNIRAFEKATGVDVIVDEAPDAITLSSFDPLRREIAAIAM